MSMHDYTHKRMLKHAGLLIEGLTAQNYQKEWDAAFSQYSDLYKDVNHVRPRGVNMKNTSVENLQSMINELRAEIDERIAARESGKVDPNDEYYERYSQYESKGSKLTLDSLRRIIKEEVARTLSEMEIVNADSGEILTVDVLPPKYTGRLMKDENGYDTLADVDFETLRKDIELDPDDALGMLEDLAAEMYGEAQGDLGTAIDLAMGIKMSEPKAWASALRSKRIKNMYYDDMGVDGMPEYDTLDDALARFLAERMG